MVPMRTPDEDGTQDGEGLVSSSLGEGFGSSAIDLTDGFGDDDFSDDDSGGSGDSDGLSDAEAGNLLEQILEDVFGDDAPEVLDNVDSQAFRPDAGEMFEPLPELEPTDIPTESDFDLAADGDLDGADLHDAAHPFDFDLSD
jgi:hypothetical protein